MTQLQGDSRLFERFEFRFPAKFHNSDKDYSNDLVVKDFSASGLKLFSKKRLFIGDQLQLLVKLPDSDSPLPVDGEVIWSRKQNSMFWEIGVEFDRIRFLDTCRMFKFCQ